MESSPTNEASINLRGQPSDKDMPSTSKADRAAISPTQPPQELPPAKRPQNWSIWSKWAYIVVVAYCDCLTLVSSFAGVHREPSTDGGQVAF